MTWAAPARRVAGGLLAVGLTFALAALSQVPYSEHRADEALVRFAWRFRSDKVQRCRTRTPQELAKLPVHMRQPQACEGGLRPYRLVIEVDGTTRGDDTIRASGATADRPLFVLEEVAVAPGRHAVKVRFEPLGSGERGAGLSSEGAGSVAPPPLLLDTVVTLGVRHVALVTLDTDRGILVLRTAPSGS